MALEDDDMAAISWELVDFLLELHMTSIEMSLFLSSGSPLHDLITVKSLLVN